MSEIEAPRGHCAECGKPMRDRKQTLAQFPGTVQHRGAGMCANDYNRARLNKEMIARLSPKERTRHDNTVAALNNYMRARQNRLARQKAAA